MIRIGLASLPLLLTLLLGGCIDREKEEEEEVFASTAQLFTKYTSAYDRQDSRALDLVREDLRRLNVRAFDVLVRGLELRDQLVQGYAAFTLGFSGRRAAMGPLAAATGHPDETVRGNAIAALGQLGFSDVPVEPFLRLLGDPVPAVRQAALFGLLPLVSETDDRGMFEAVQRACGDSNRNVRNEALIVLRKLRRRESLGLILSGPLKDPDPLVRASAALVLGALGRGAKEATPFLIEMLKDDASRVVEAAWSALNKIYEKDLDRSYATWRDWFEDEQKMHYTCIEHKEISESSPGECPKCRRKLERVPRDGYRRGELIQVTGLFTCPDHPEVVTTTPARCGKPGCGKELVPRKADPVIYSCPEHPEILTTTPAKCGKPGCGRDLVPIK